MVNYQNGKGDGEGSRGMTVKEFLEQIEKEEILHGKKYSLRIDVDDGFYNSYIGFDVDVETYNRKTPVTSSLRLHRHTNDINGLVNTWGFALGNIIHSYPQNRNVPLEFRTYGKDFAEAEKEASEYFAKIKKLIRKRTSDIKIQMASEAEEEKEQLLARLEELKGVENVSV